MQASIHQCTRGEEIGANRRKVVLGICKASTDGGPVVGLPYFGAFQFASVSLVPGGGLS